MAADEIVLEGSAYPEYDLRQAIRLRLDLAAPPAPEKKGFFARLRGA